MPTRLPALQTEHSRRVYVALLAILLPTYVVAQEKTDPLIVCGEGYYTQFYCQNPILANHIQTECPEVCEGGEGSSGSNAATTTAVPTSTTQTVTIATSTTATREKCGIEVPHNSKKFCTDGNLHLECIFLDSNLFPHLDWTKRCAEKCKSGCPTEQKCNGKQDTASCAGRDQYCTDDSTLGDTIRSDCPIMCESCPSPVTYVYSHQTSEDGGDDDEEEGRVTVISTTATLATTPIQPTRSTSVASRTQTSTSTSTSTSIPTSTPTPTVPTVILLVPTSAAASPMPASFKSSQGSTAPTATVPLHRASSDRDDNEMETTKSSASAIERDAPSTDGPKQLQAPVGIIVGALAVLIVALLVLFCYWKRRRKARSTEARNAALAINNELFTMGSIAPANDSPAYAAIDDAVAALQNASRARLVGNGGVAEPAYAELGESNGSNTRRSSAVSYAQPFQPQTERASYAEIEVPGTQRCHVGPTNAGAVAQYEYMDAAHFQQGQLVSGGGGGADLGNASYAEIADDDRNAATYELLDVNPNAARSEMLSTSWGAAAVVPAYETLSATYETLACGDNSNTYGNAGRAISGLSPESAYHDMSGATYDTVLTTVGSSLAGVMPGDSDYVTQVPLEQQQRTGAGGVPAYQNQSPAVGGNVVGGGVYGPLSANGRTPANASASTNASGGAYGARKDQYGEGYEVMNPDPATGLAVNTDSAYEDIQC